MIKSIAYLNCIAALGGLGGPVSAHAQTTAASAPAARDGSHDMDFLLGTWHTEITLTPDPFRNPSKVVHLSGTATAKPIWPNGKGQLEVIEADGPGVHWEGALLSFYDPTAHQWTESFVDSSEGHFDGPASYGEYRNGNVEYYSRYTVNGRTMLYQGLWSDIRPNSCTYTTNFSDDGGRTWHQAFIGHMTRNGK